MTDSKGNKVIVCDNGTGVRGVSVSDWLDSFSLEQGGGLVLLFMAA